MDPEFFANPSAEASKEEMEFFSKADVAQSVER
jgi:hypothetical protein